MKKAIVIHSLNLLSTLLIIGYFYDLSCNGYAAPDNDGGASKGANNEDEDHKDFLERHPLIYIAATLLLFIFQTVVLVLMGQPLISVKGIKFWNGDAHGPENSQHMSDWYTFTHIVHGFIMFYVVYFLPHPITVHYGYLIALGTGVTWEIIENTPCVINQYRKSSLAAGYVGDSVINSFCDSAFMSGGYWLSYFVPWYVILALGIAEEVLLGIIIRDNMTLNIIQLAYPFKTISDWQARGGKRVPAGTTANPDNENDSNNPDTQQEE